MLGEDYATEHRDISRIKKLNTLTDISTFWDDVRKMTKNITTDHAISRWQVLAEAKYDLLTKGE